MKLPVILYFSIFAVLMALDVSSLFLQNNDANRSDDLAEFVAPYESAVPTSGSPIVTEFYPASQVTQVTVHPGFVLINDGEMSDRIEVSLPEAAKPYLELENEGGELSFDFNRSVRLSEPVAIRVNLSRLNPKVIEVYLREAYNGRTQFQPDLISETPIASSYLKLKGLPNHSIQVMAENLTVFGVKNLSSLEGAVGNLEIVKPKSVSSDSLPVMGLDYRKIILTDRD